MTSCHNCEQVERILWFISRCVLTFLRKDTNTQPYYKQRLKILVEMLEQRMALVLFGLIGETQ